MDKIFKSILVLLAVAFINFEAPVFAAGNGERALSPLNYGLKEARNGKERYQALLRCHIEAYEKGLPVSYRGIDTIRLDLPSDAYSIPLTQATDFAGCVIIVTNNSGKSLHLFALNDRGRVPAKVEVDRRLIDGGDFSSVPELKSGDYLLIIEDLTPWSGMVGSGTPVVRYDLLMLHNGKAINRPICNYSSNAAKPSCTYVAVNDDNKSIANVTIVRTKESKNMTFCFRIANQMNLELSKIRVITPAGSSLHGDMMITMENCANCLISDVDIENTYSSKGKYGFAFCMTNVVNCNFERLNVTSEYTPFETYSLNNISLSDCKVKRFDLLCYGRNIKFYDCPFTNNSLNFSSLFEGCQFDDCTPVIVQSMYNAYTPFDVKFSKCSITLTRDHHNLVNVKLYSLRPNSRPELAPRCWPNIDIEDMTVNTSRTGKRLDILEPSGALSECDKPIDYFSRISVNGLRTMSNGAPGKCDMYFTKHKFKTAEKVNVSYTGVELSGGEMVNYFE